MPAVLNLNNEVVRLRAEVKRVRVLIIRKLIRQISVLEKKKGSQEDLEKHRRRAARLLEEIKEMKGIVPDKVTKSALQMEISFEKVCKNKEATISDRAIARIATHPQFNKKIQILKDAIKAFKDERINEMKSEKQVKKKADNLKDQPQEVNDNKGPEKLEDEEMKPNEEKKPNAEMKPNEEKKLNEEKKPNEEEEDEMIDKPHEDSSVEEVLLKMRRESKNIRVLVLGKLTRKMGALKKKKGDESAVKTNQELIAELMKDIQALRNLKPDQPTMTALQQNVELDKVLQDPQASPMDRVIAHIVTHSRFINKLQKVKNLIEEKKAKAAEAKRIEMDRLKNDGMTGMEKEEDGEEEEDDYSEEDKDEEEDDSEEDKEEEEDDSEEDKEEDKEKEDDDDDEVGEENLTSLSIKVHKPEETTGSDAVKLPPIQVITTPEKSKATIVKSQNAKVTSSKFSPKKSSTVSNTESKLPINVKKTEKQTEIPIKPETNARQQKDNEESDLSDDDEEKEYFDDSTEERFRKQSSQSEESEDDDFFISKVSKFKKRKSGKAKVQAKETQAIEKPQETILGKYESDFCSTLSKSSTSSQRVKHGSRQDGSKPPRFQKKGHDGRMKPSLYKDRGNDRRAAPFKPNKQTFNNVGKRQDGPPGAGRGRSQFEQYQNQNSRGPGGKISNQQQELLHPSWEASRKRKEQQAHIPVFQGKKIRFGDDD
ncbi:serum response factor-binding protein 1 [Triplophysa dalaica]|uniref:serum response factor-binding protein 1 n=1 Tax=Triplophysa dalaica TaxID=1582913 RepID=UPI0024DFF269|nr:serum response factor-binding protein 1 [Triplophysa dalaica]